MAESDPKATLEAIFDIAIGFGYKAAEMYKDFSQLFVDVQEVADFWRGLAEDEYKHVNILRQICKSLTSEQLLSPCDYELAMKVENRVFPVFDDQ